MTDKDECIYWMGARDKKGYGTFDNKYAHRLAYEKYIGPIPHRMQIDHLCHTLDINCVGGLNCPHRACVNPNHLEAVTQQENIKRGRGISNLNAAKTHCINGHLFDNRNTYIRANGGRVCIACRKEGLRRWYIRKKNQ